MLKRKSTKSYIAIILIFALLLTELSTVSSAEETVPTMPDLSEYRYYIIDEIEPETKVDDIIADTVCLDNEEINIYNSRRYLMSGCDFIGNKVNIRHGEVMSNHSYNVEAYNATLQAELNKLWVIGILLLIVLIAMVVYSLVLIKEGKTKKFPYVQLIGVVIISIFLMFSFGCSIISYSKDLADEAYIQYEGPAAISKQRKVVLGNIPTWYNEYVVAFENNGEQITLSTRKNYEKDGNIENVYIVYAQNSGIILEFIE